MPSRKLFRSEFSLHPQKPCINVTACDHNLQRTTYVNLAGIVIFFFFFFYLEETHLLSPMWFGSYLRFFSLIKKHQTTGSNPPVAQCGKAVLIARDLCWVACGCVSIYQSTKKNGQEACFVYLRNEQDIWNFCIDSGAHLAIINKSENHMFWVVSFRRMYCEFLGFFTRNVPRGFLAFFTINWFWALISSQPSFVTDLSLITVKFCQEVHN